MAISSRARVMTLGLSMAFLAMAADQISKWWILERVMQPPRVIPVTDFFNLVLGWNRGVSFGLFNNPGSSAWLLTGVALALVSFLLVWLWRSGGVWLPVALGLIIGGAIGNVIDRVRFGAVTDFLDFYIGGWHWPAFNMADLAISVGVAILILDSLFQRPENPDT